MDRGVVLPEFAQAGALPAAAGFAGGWDRLHEEREVVPGISGDGFAIPLESEAGGQFIGHELIVGRSLEGPKGAQKGLDFDRPIRAVVAAGEVGGECGGMLQPGGTQAEKMGAADTQKFGGSIGV